MSARSIERIVRPDDETFRHEYINAQRPVIITNLFAGQPIEQINTFESAAQLLRGTKLLVQHEYSSGGAITGAQQLFSTITYEEYWRAVERNPDTAICCTEYEVPARILAQVRLPSVCEGRDIELPEVLSLPRKYGDHDLLANLFIANRGNKAHLHYDGDHRQVFLHQVFGRKEVILFPTRSGHALEPLRFGLNFSGWDLEHMSPAQRLELIDRADGYHEILQPGETVYIPMLMWHYLGYVDHAMSFNFRFGRSRYGRFLCADNFHRDHYIQNFSSKLVAGAMQDSRIVSALAQITREYAAPTPDIPTKVRAMRTVFRALCAQICPEHRAHEYCPPEHEQAELERILQDISRKVVYADRERIMKMRPSGPITAMQARHIRENAARFAYPQGVLQQLLKNRVGKSEIDSLSSVEAAQFLQYMRSPGAAWR